MMMMNKYLHKTDFLITNWDALSGFEKSEELRKVVFCKSYNKITKKDLLFLLCETINLIEAGEYRRKNHFRGYAELINYLNTKKHQGGKR